MKMLWEVAYKSVPPTKDIKTPASTTKVITYCKMKRTVNRKKNLRGYIRREVRKKLSATVTICNFRSQ